MKQSDSREEALNENAGSRPPIRKCREQSLQEHPLREGTALAMAQEALKGEIEIILSGDQKLMIPRLTAMVTACARSLAPSFERMLVTRLLMVASATNR
jgi:hypothetical protein